MKTSSVGQEVPSMTEIQQNLQSQLIEMSKTGRLFKSSATGDEVWNLYMKSLPNDPIFRDPNSSEHNCNLCKGFIRRYGNILAIKDDGEVMTLWDKVPQFWQIEKVISESQIQDVFFETFQELNSMNYEKCKKTNSVFRLGINQNFKRYTKEEAEKFGVVEPDEIRTFNHLFLDMPVAFIDMSNKSIEAIRGEFRDAKNVFQRCMEEIPLDTLELVKDLINQGSLLDGETHLYKVLAMIPVKKAYDKVDDSAKDDWCWVNSYKFQFAKFKNELIGVLCSELAEGKELNAACMAWNKRVDPSNYMKATAPITRKQIAEAKKFVEENGYEESFSRRFATIDDIKVSEILHSNVGDQKIKSVSIFDNVKSTSTRHKRSEFEGVEEVQIDKFMKDILPTCTSIEAFLTNKQEGNLVSLTTANNPESKPIFKWSNNYSWTYNGNLAGKSQIKEQVVSKGGNVTGVLRFSMIWNESGSDNSDLDAWCQQPNAEQIGFHTGFRKDSGNRLSSCSGQLDLDNTNPGGKLAVENIYFADLKRMQTGVYKFWVNQYCARNSQGFKAEIEFEGETYSYEYNRPVSGSVQVAEVSFKNGEFNIVHKLAESHSTKEYYGLETNQFHKVNLVCLSPNHWNGESVGNKHYFFMLQDCKSPVPIRSFHNENLIPDLITKHRGVMEVLGNTNMIESTDKQLSGLGFNATVRDEVILRLGGTHKRVIRVKF